MVTGDNIHTAKAIALECGILQVGPLEDLAVIEGRVFRNYTKEEQQEIVDKICVSIPVSIQHTKGKQQKSKQSMPTTAS